MARVPAQNPMVNFSFDVGQEVVFRVGTGKRVPNGIGRLVRLADANVVVEQRDGTLKRVPWQNVICLSAQEQDALSKQVV